MEYNILPNTLGARIALLRKQAGLTQAQLGEQLDVSSQAVSKWESQASCPDISTLVPLAKILGVSTDVLLGADTVLEAEGEDEGQPEVEPEIEDMPLPTLIPAEPEAVHTLTVRIGAARVRLETGSSFHLETIGYQGSDYSSKIENGVWTIKDRYASKALGLRIFGMQKPREMVLTIPEGHHFRNVCLSVGAGELQGRGIYTDSSKLEVGAGQMQLHQFFSKSAALECSMGNIILEGGVSGRCSLQCGMGNIDANLHLNGDYGYRVDIGMGEVNIGQNKFSGIGGEYAVNPSAENFYDIKCSMGSIKLMFES